MSMPSLSRSLDWRVCVCGLIGCAGAWPMVGKAVVAEFFARFAHVWLAGTVVDWWVRWPLGGQWVLWVGFWVDNVFMTWGSEARMVSRSRLCSDPCSAWYWIINVLNPFDIYTQSISGWESHLARQTWLYLNPSPVVFGLNSPIAWCLGHACPKCMAGCSRIYMYLSLRYRNRTDSQCLFGWLYKVLTYIRMISNSAGKGPSEWLMNPTAPRKSLKVRLFSNNTRRQLLSSLIRCIKGHSLHPSTELARAPSSQL